MALRRPPFALALLAIAACSPLVVEAPTRPDPLPAAPPLPVLRDVTPTFSRPLPSPTPTPAAPPRRVDLSGDGAADAVVGSPSINAVTLFVSEGAPLTLSAPSGRFGAALAYAGDLDGDGRSDLAVGAPGDDAVYLYAGAAGGVDPLPRAVLRGAVGSGFGATLCAAGDLDGDGRDDLVIGSVAAGAISLVRGVSGSMPALLGALRGPADEGYGATIVAFGDGSGRVAVGVPGGGSVAVVMARDGALRETARIVVSPHRIVDVGLAALDADGDGRVDLALTGGGLGGVVWIRGTADGFAAPSDGPPGAGAGTWLLSAGDLDGDGDDELLVGSAAGLWVLPGDRAGAATLRPWDLARGGSTGALAAIRDADGGPATVLRGVPSEDAVERLVVDRSLAATAAATLLGPRGAAFGAALAR